MNNARYLRELDFAKIDFYEKTDLYRKIKQYGGSLVLGATTIRYRRFIKLFHKYKITSKVMVRNYINVFIFVCVTDYLLGR